LIERHLDALLKQTARIGDWAAKRLAGLPTPLVEAVSVSGRDLLARLAPEV